jgi:hypothetical protein
MRTVSKCAKNNVTSVNMNAAWPLCAYALCVSAIARARHSTHNERWNAGGSELRYAADTSNHSRTRLNASLSRHVHINYVSLVLHVPAHGKAKEDGYQHVHANWFKCPAQSISIEFQRVLSSTVTHTHPLSTCDEVPYSCSSSPRNTRQNSLKVFGARTQSEIRASVSAHVQCARHT